MKIPDRIEPQVRAVAELLQDQWFDRTRRVQTSGEVSLHDAGVNPLSFGDSEAYQPARPHHIRQALRDIAIDDVSSYDYVDLGSGKGRSLFVAAERPFRQVTGVEFSPRLHVIATRNIANFRRVRRGTRAIQSLHMDATRFLFSESPLVLYMFNPFGVTTIRQVLANLQHSLAHRRRHVVIILLWPQWQGEVAAMPDTHLLIKREQFCIYDAYRGLRSSVQQAEDAPSPAISL